MNNQQGHFKKQFEFIENSSALFDLGKKNEAVRIAVCFRVLMHDTKNSTSLFSLLKVKEDIRIISTANPNIDGVKSFGFSLTGVVSTGNEAKLKPNMHNFHSCDEVPLEKWWNQIVFAMPDIGAFTRKDFILVAANKDGGAHVDELPEKYLKLKGGETGCKVSINGLIQTDFSEMWPCVIRQAAWEFLNSPDMLVLLEQG